MNGKHRTIDRRRSQPLGMNLNRKPETGRPEARVMLQHAWNTSRVRHCPRIMMVEYQGASSLSLSLSVWSHWYYLQSGRRGAVYCRGITKNHNSILYQLTHIYSSNWHTIMPSSYSEESPLLVSNQSHNAPGRHDERVGMNSTEQRRKKYNMFRTFVLPVACLIVVLIIVKDAISTNHGKEAKPSFLSPSLRDDHDDKDHKSQSQKSSSPSYTKVQTLSFQIYTGGAPAFIMDESTGKERKNHECKGCKCLFLEWSEVKWMPFVFWCEQLLVGAK